MAVARNNNRELKAYCSKTETPRLSTKDNRWEKEVSWEVNGRLETGHKKKSILRMSQGHLLLKRARSKALK